MTRVEFYDPSFTPESGLIYSVIVAKYKDEFLFVRHRNRTTWEIPGGHIEENETSDNTAYRELVEETGAIDFKLEFVATYSVSKKGETGFGGLYFAEIFKLGPIPDRSEIAGIRKLFGLPENLTYPDIQPILFRKVIEYLNGDNVK